MAREGEWEIWYGAWLSTLILAPLGIFFTYQANKDSGIFNGDSIAAFFRMLFAIPEKRHIAVKEVIIETPDYVKDCVVLNELHHQAREYKKVNRLKKLPSIGKIFFNENDVTIDSFNEKFENLIEEMGNSRNRKVIIHLNEFPILAPHATVSPFKKRWMNIASLLFFPVGVFIYLRAVKFRIRLAKDLVKIESNSKKLISIIEKEKLI